MSSLIVEVVRVDKLEKHPNADTLEIAHIKGWRCIVKQGQFRPGDLAIYIPIDSVLPDKLIEQYGLTYLKNGSRVRTIKLRGEISQGLLLNLPSDVKWRLGQNVAGELGIKKWEPPASEYQQSNERTTSVKEPNPLFYRYTDIENWKNFPDVFEPGDHVVVTEKVHGTNARYGTFPKMRRTWWEKLLGIGKTEFLVGSHRVQLTGNNVKFIYYDDNVYVRIAKRYHLDKIVPEGAILFGEIYGHKIQDLTYGLDDIDVVFFDLMVDGKYLPHEQFEAWCKERGLPTAPILFVGSYYDGLIQEYVQGDSVLAASHGSKQMREGIVIRDEAKTFHPKIGRKILKAINDDYLLRRDATEYH